MEELEKLLQKGFILFLKNGKIEIQRPPAYGSVTLNYQNGTFTHLIKTETIK